MTIKAIRKRERCIIDGIYLAKCMSLTIRYRVTDNLIHIALAQQQFANGASFERVERI